MKEHCASNVKFFHSATPKEARIEDGAFVAKLKSLHCFTISEFRPTADGRRNIILLLFEKFEWFRS